MNSILTYCASYLGLVMAVWSVIEIASSMDLFGQYANWSGSGMMELMCTITSLSKRFTIYRYECYRVVVIVGESENLVYACSCGPCRLILAQRLTVFLAVLSANYL